jgi:hypothetical protein
VLKDFLQEHGTEVNNVLFDDWTIEKEKAWAREEGIEVGREEGRYAQATDVLAYINAGGTIDGLRERLSRSVSVGSLPASS